MKQEKIITLILFALILIIALTALISFTNSNDLNSDLNNNFDLNSDLNNNTDFNNSDLNSFSYFYNPKCYYDEFDETISCDNSIFRIRPTKTGIIWFDFFNAKEQKWYVNKNNLNLVVRVKDSEEWQNTELNQVQPKVEIISEGSEELNLKYSFVFPNKAKIFLNVTLKKAEPYIYFEVHKEKDSVEITGFQWHITFGQAEAVSRLHFDSFNIFAKNLSQPFPGKSLEVQHVEFFNNLNEQEFIFMGNETNERDENNPQWMTRVLGLKQHVSWTKKMRSNDVFAFEARTVPWQASWKIPETTPWIEGLWFIRNDSFLEGDSLV
ncbi:MAG: hypothetical protein JW703_04185, partial [Candidatus Diapherotrites archaeon]|nr:hypothetical protein [Candidatus Diapherotrites archaeon]